MVDCLGISNHSEVYIACKPVSVYWRDLGDRLGVLVNTLDDIETDCNGNVRRCISAMLEKWLRRSVGEVRDGTLPTWRSLCKALSYIDRPLAEAVSVEHDCNYSPAGSSRSSSSDVSPAFFPQMCGCGKCTVIGLKTGIPCKSVYFTRYPKMLVIDPKHASASLLKRSDNRKATLCKATSGIIGQFQLLVSDIWDQLYDSVDSHEVGISKITRALRSGLDIQLPMFSNLDSLQNHLHSLRISWYNFRALHLLVTRVMAKLSPTLLADWNSYLARFKEYCSARNLEDVFFRVEEHNIFLLEVDEFYNDFTMSDIESLSNSLSIVLGCPSVSLHLVTVGEEESLYGYGKVPSLTQKFPNFYKKEYENLRNELSSMKVQCATPKQATNMEVSTVQFDSTVSMCDLTHDAAVAGEQLFVIEGEDHQYYEWEECGLVVDVPGSGVPPLSSCEMRVSALAGGDFIFPDDHELVSAVYAVTFSRSLQQDVVLELQHCVDLQIQEDVDLLSFAVAEPLPSPGSYTFTTFKRGKFSLKDRYGSIEVSESLCYCIIMKECSRGGKKGKKDPNKRSSDCVKKGQERSKKDHKDAIGKDDSVSGGGTGTAGGDSSGEDSSSRGDSSDEQPDSEEGDQTSEEEMESHTTSENEWEVKQTTQQWIENQDPPGPPIKSSGFPSPDECKRTIKRCYFCQIFIVKKPTRCWDAEVIFAKDLNVLKRYIARNSHRGSVEGIVGFQFNEDFLTLDVPPMVPQDCKGWRVVPIVQHPYKIHQDKIDLFGKNRPPQPVPSKYVAVSEPESDRLLVYPLMINDVEGAGLTLNIVIDSAQEAGDPASKEDDGLTPPSTGRCKKLDSAATPSSDILEKKPSQKDAFNLLRDQSRHWDDIGLQLDVPFDVRDGWCKDNSFTNLQRLERVINMWLEGACHTPVTWNELIKVLKDSLCFVATAKRIETFLQGKNVYET